MAVPTGYNYDDGGFGEGIPPDLRSRDLPSKRLLGKGLASIGYETEWQGERYARKDFVGVPSNIFLNEAAALVRLKDVHPNVVKTHGFTIDKMSCSLVLEYMDDKLSGLLQKRKDQRKRIPAGNQPEHISTLPFELHEALDFMLPIAKGMEYLHEQGILHGDLKTRNILISYLNSASDKNFSDVKSVKVSDFGLVQTKRNGKSHVSQVRKLDTIRWTAPENLKKSTESSESDSNSDEECTVSSRITLRALLSADVYSFAVTCSQILTGEEPYPRRNWKELEAGILSGKLRLKLPPDPLCPPMLSKLLVLCWNTDPEKRPTFADIRKELEHMHPLRTWVAKEEREQKAYLREQLEKDSSSLKPMKLVGRNFPISKAFDADSSMASPAPAPDPDPDPHDEHLRNGKALVSEYTEPNESIPTVLGKRETFKEIHDQIRAHSRPDDVGPYDQFRDNYGAFMDPLGLASSASSVAMEQKTLEPLWHYERGYQRSSAAMDDYDVFLNCCGRDVGGGFIAHLYDAISSVGLNPFLDSKCLVMGHDVLNSIDHALEAANICVAVVSKGYAESKYCLRELVAMIRSRKRVIPVFYDVKPADLRSVERGPFAAAFEKHKSRESAEQVEEWVDALRNLAEITGLSLSNYMGDEAKLKHDVLDVIFRFMPPRKVWLFDNYVVGMEEHIITCINKLEKISNATYLLGLVGMGGIGKTTLAKKICNYYIGRKKFQAMSFLELDCNSPRSKGVDSSLLTRLQQQLMWDLLREPRIQQDYYYWFRKLSSKGPVLIVLDNIHEISQFDMLISDTGVFAPGSLIIVTSRDQHFLNIVGARMPNFYLHEVNPLNCTDSQKLFNFRAFIMKSSGELQGCSK